MYRCDVCDSLRNGKPVIRKGERLCPICARTIKMSLREQKKEAGK